jgi:DNA anti-recombination protein RmuC
MADSFVISIILSIGIVLTPFVFRKRGIVPVANLVVSLGILGTFGGIVIGLIQFDVNDIDGSVPILLSGLRFAFLTSIAGIATGVLVRIIPGVYRIENQTGESPESIESSLKEMVDGIQKMHLAISGDSDSSVVTQVKLLNHSNSKLLKEQTKTMEDFAAKLVASSTEPLIEAIQEVFTDFNSKINEKLGSSIHQFSESVAELRSWQIENSEQITKLSTAFSELLSRISQIPDDLSRLAKGLETVQLSTKQFSSLSSELVGVIRSLENLVSRMETLVPGVQDNLDGLIAAATKNIDSGNEALRSAKKSYDEQERQFSKSVEEIGKKFHQVFDTLNGRLEEISNTNATRITEQVAKLDEQLGEELKKSLETLGNQLASLSEKFVSDYTPLTRKLQSVVEIAKRIDA